MKKGSLNLSINAIVVLILAITMLGLGLGFIRSLFGGATNSLTDALGKVGQQRIDNFRADCSEDICLEKNTVEVKRNEEADVLLAINNLFDCTIPSATITIDEDNCKRLDGGDCSGHIEISTFTEQEVGPKQKVILPINVKAKTRAELTQYRYPILVEGACGGNSIGGKKQFLDVKVIGG